ncbi:Uncharacterized protein TPAR_03695, partial [Tolypocladium paradoxum]
MPPSNSSVSITLLLTTTPPCATSSRSIRTANIPQHPHSQHPPATRPRTRKPQRSTTATMLRRAPTTLAVTPEDVAAYEDRRAGEARAAQTPDQQPQPQQLQQQ